MTYRIMRERMEMGWFVLIIFGLAFLLFAEDCESPVAMHSFTGMEVCSLHVASGAEIDSSLVVGGDLVVGGSIIGDMDSLTIGTTTISGDEAGILDIFADFMDSITYSDSLLIGWKAAKPETLVDVR